MEKIDFKDIYIDGILEEIKKEVRKWVNLEESNNVQDISGDRIGMADSKMRLVLKDILVNKENNPNSEYSYNFLLLNTADKDEAKKELRRYLVLYYTALYFDNVETLQRLVRGGAVLCGEYGILKLGLLDSDISSIFSKDKYVEIVKKSEDLLISFYDSIRKLDFCEKNKYLKKFSDIVHKRPELLDVNALIFGADRLTVYDEETYLKGSLQQISRIIGSCNIYKNEENRVHANRLIQETDFTVDYHYVNLDSFFENFSDEELLEMSPQEAGFFARAFSKNIDVERIKILLAKRKSLVNYQFISEKPRFLELFTDAEILEMSEEVLKEFKEKEYRYFPGYDDKKKDAAAKRLVKSSSVKRLFSFEGKKEE